MTAQIINLETERNKRRILNVPRDLQRQITASGENKLPSYATQGELNAYAAMLAAMQTEVN